MFTCPLCQNKYKKLSGLSNHISRSHNIKISDNKDLQYKIYSQKINKEKIKDICEKYKKGFSLPDLREQYDLDFKTLIIFIEYNNIKIRSIRKSKKEDRCKSKSKQTNLKKYGYEHNFCKKHPSRLKWQKRLKKEYGVDNVFQREDVKDKITQYWMSNFGVTHPMELEWIKKKIEKTNIRRYGTPHPIRKKGLESGEMTKPHKKINKFLKQANKIFENEFHIKVKEHNYYIDIFIDGKIIEIYGDYWHCNPLKYNKNDLVHFPYGKVKVDKIWERDAKRIKAIENEGYEVLILWEEEIINNKFKEKICEFLKLKK